MKNIRLPRKKLLLISAVLLLATGAVFAYKVIPQKNDQELTPTSDGKHVINLQPPSEAEKSQAESNKDKAADRQKLDEQPQPTTSVATVTPVVSSWGQDAYTKDVSVAGYVPGIFEDSGTCTLTLEKSGVSITKSQKATKNVSSVSCGYINVPWAELSTGEWIATISYTSATSQGISGKQKIDVN